MDYKNNISNRKNILEKLLINIQKNEELIIQALYDDFRKPKFESIITETSFVISDLKNTIKNIYKFSKPRRVFPFLLNFPSSDFIYKEPYGKVLIISPWNYPFQLAFCPLIAAVASGNDVVLKPSELTPRTSNIISKIIKETFNSDHVDVIEGGINESNELLSKRWDYIFFTGSVSVGKIVAKAAAEYLTPVTLELGGKNPCIIDESANLKLAAKRIVWGKFINAGQTCIAPDYLLVQKNVKEDLLEYLKDEIIKAYGHNTQNSPDYARIINTKNWTRLVNLIVPQKIFFGGQTDERDCFISPTIIDENTLDSDIMKDEIFGPLLPVITYDKETEIETIINRYEKPLALYVFTQKKLFAENIIRTLSFGGGCVNDTIVHIANKNLPFGGVGYSGIGAYHGKFSFDTFSHHKSITKRGNWIDIPLRYAPYKGKLQIIKNLLNLF